MSDLRITQLDSGLTVATERVPGALSVATGAWVAVGSRDEPDEIAGVSHFLEHLLFKGTATRSAHDIARGVDRRGGDFNAYTTKEYTAYFCRLPARHAMYGIDLLGDVLCRPALRDDDVQAERRVILDELAMDDEAPEDVAHRAFAASLFADHPLGRDPAGDREHVRRITPDDVRGFFERHYRAGSMVVAVAGALAHDEMLAAVDGAFGGIGAGGGRPARSAPLRVGGDVAIDDDTEQVHMVIGSRAVARGDDRREALEVVNHVFGGGLSSRLFEQIRERRGLAYAVYSGVAAFDDCGSFQMYAGTLPRHAAEVRELMLTELAKVVAEGITDDELDIAKGYLTGAFELALEDTGARMARAGASLITTGDVRTIDEQVARWAAVDQAAVAGVIEEVLAGDPLAVTVGPAR